MNKFNIYNIEGEVIAKGCPRYVSTFGQPDYLEFSSISSPDPIDFTVGCYVDYQSGTSGFGYPDKYSMYTIPQVTKQARKNSCGDAFVYSNVQFYAPTMQLKRKLFRDIVQYDNEIHFSTRENISTYENVAGIAARIEACMNAEIGTVTSNTWHVSVVDYDDSDLKALVETPKEFAMSAGSTCLDALNEIYNLWQGIGWVYTHEDDGYHIYLGKPNMQVNGNTTKAFLYGKGKGLKIIKKSLSTAQDFATRIFAYGSTRNMVSRRYNALDIYNADSVDIPNLMIPLSHWGTTGGKRDARKAYVQNASAIQKFGEIEKVIYFDGTGDYDEIYPSIEKMTFGEIRSSMASTDKYYPASKYGSTNRADAINTGSSVTDSGIYMDLNNGSATIESGSNDNWVQGSDFSVDMGRMSYFSYDLGTFVIGTVTQRGKLSLTTKNWGIKYTTDKAYTGDFYAKVAVKVGNTIVINEERQILPDSNNNFIINFSSFQSVFSGVYESGGEVRVHISINGMGSNEYNVRFTCDSSYPSETPHCEWRSSYDLVDTFSIVLPQIGFNIAEQATTASTGIGTICMKDGMCGGREFAIKSCTYDSVADAWNLVCYRQNDTDVSQYFPNSSFQIAQGDHYVLTDIVMPPLYVSAAETRLYNEAQRVLAQLSKPKYVYEPEVDPIHQLEDASYLSSGRYMWLRDADVIDDTDDYILIDSVTITYNEYSIPTIKVTLRDEKADSFFTKTTRAQYKVNREVAGVKEKIGSNYKGVSTKADGGSGSGTVEIELTPQSIANALGYVPASQANIPTKTSQLTNDSGFLTSIDSAAITQALGYTPARETLFIVTRGTTTYAQAYAAYQKGQVLVCKDGNTYYSLYQYVPQSGTTNAHFIFVATSELATYYLYLHYGTSWESGEEEKPTSPYTLSLSRDRSSLSCDSNGDILSGQTISSVQASLYYGSTPVTTGITWSLEGASKPTGVSINQSGVITFNMNSFSMSGLLAEFTVKAVVTDSNGNHTATKIHYVEKVCAGQNGDTNDIEVEWSCLDNSKFGKPCKTSPTDTGWYTYKYNIVNDEPVGVIKVGAETGYCDCEGWMDSIPADLSPYIKKRAEMKVKNGVFVGEWEISRSKGYDSTRYWLVVSPVTVLCDKTNGYAPDRSRIAVTAMMQKGIGSEQAAEGCTLRYLPYFRTTHESDNPVIISGGYIDLTSNFCTAYYKVEVQLLKNDILLSTQDVMFISDGIDSTEQGRQGAAIRGAVEWKDGLMGTRRFCNGEYNADYEEDAKWIDIVLYDGHYYRCITSFTNASGNRWNNVSSKFQNADEEFEFIATKLLLSKQAKVDFLTNIEFYLMNKNNVITGGGAAATNDSDIIFWAGASSPSQGKWKVDYMGNMYAKSGTFAGYVQMPYTLMTELGKNTYGYIADHRAYLIADAYCETFSAGDGGTVLQLPEPSADYNGFTYHILATPEIATKADGQAPRLSVITTGQTLSMRVYAYSDNTFGNVDFARLSFFGGHIEITCLPYHYGTASVGYVWAVTRCTGGVNCFSGMDTFVAAFSTICGYSKIDDKHTIVRIMTDETIPSSKDYGTLYIARQ